MSENASKLILHLKSQVENKELNENELDTAKYPTGQLIEDVGAFKSTLFVAPVRQPMKDFEISAPPKLNNSSESDWNRKWRGFVARQRTYMYFHSWFFYHPLILAYIPRTKYRNELNLLVSILKLIFKTFYLQETVRKYMSNVDFLRHPNSIASFETTQKSDFLSCPDKLFWETRISNLVWNTGN